MGQGKTYKATTRESSLEQSRKQNKTKKGCSCCSKTCWAITALIAILLLLVSVGGIGELIRRLRIATNPIDFVKSVGECTKCPACYACLAGFTGQDVRSLCMAEDLSTVLQCTAQIFYLYSQPNIDDSIPCYSTCRPCRNCLNTLSFGAFDLTTTLWETIFPHLFIDSTEIGDTDNSCEINCTESLNCTMNCPDHESEITQTPGLTTSTEYPIQENRRRKRAVRFDDDGDTCCQTMRKSTAYLIPYIDDDGRTWYPVWFHKPWVTPSYSFQYYDEIECPLPHPSCDDTLTCEPYPAKRTMLMTRQEPNSYSGYTYILLSYPNNNVKFINLDLDCYCRCEN